jgi:hypothetical protein
MWIFKCDISTFIELIYRTGASKASSPEESERICRKHFSRTLDGFLSKNIICVMIYSKGFSKDLCKQVCMWGAVLRC